MGRLKWAVSASRIRRKLYSRGRTRTSNPPALTSSSRRSTSRVCDNNSTTELPEQLARRLTAGCQSLLSNCWSYNTIGKTIWLTRFCARCQLAAQINTYLVFFRRASMKCRSSSKLESRRTGAIGMDRRRGGPKTGFGAVSARFDLRRWLRILVTGFVTLHSLQAQPMLRWAASVRHGAWVRYRSRPTQVSHIYKLDRFECRSYHLGRVW